MNAALVYDTFMQLKHSEYYISGILAELLNNLQNMASDAELDCPVHRTPKAYSELNFQSEICCRYPRN